MAYIAIRAAGNSNQGMGHIVRCISLAQELILNNFEILFLIDNDLGVINFLNKYAFEFIAVSSSNLSFEIKKTKKIIKQKNIKILITDSYHLSNNYFIEMKNCCPYLISIDDMNLYDYTSDIVINYNIYAKDLNYNFNKNTKYLLGCKYCLLREEFRTNDFIAINKTCKNVLVTMGGSDINNFTYTVLNYLYNFNNIKFNVVVNNQFKDLDQLKSLALSKNNINLIFNPYNMKSTMLENDIAISASGSTSYELISLLIPSILIIQIDNQEMICEKFANINACIYGGWFNKLDEKNLKIIFNDLLNDYNKRKEISNNCKDIVYKNGVSNVVNEIKKLFLK